jgi:DNA-binding response OmpR family regulator
VSADPTIIPTDRAATILIVDDESDSVRPLLGILADQAVHALVAVSASEGLSQAVRQQPSLILLDVGLPDADGFEVCRQLKANLHTQTIPVIFLSGMTGVHDKLQGFAAGAVDYITKPYAPEEVLARVALQLAARQRWVELDALATANALERLPRGGRSRDDDLFDAARRILQDSLGAPPALLALSHRVGTNERKLKEIFRARVGLSVFEYFQELRMDSARRSLEATQARVQQVAKATGYPNAGDFSRAFKRRYGLSPRQFRACKNLPIDDEAE